MNTHLDNQTPAIEFRNVFLSFDDHLVLNDISFKLERGGMIFLTGVSGSGKSVLLRLAIGLLKPDSGQILIEGREIEKLDEEQLIDLRGGRMGIVFQEDSLFTGLPVYENVAYRLGELVIRARDLNQISSLYVTKKIHELNYLGKFRAEVDSRGEITTVEAGSMNLPKTRVIVLEDGRIVFSGSVMEFAKSNLPAIRELSALDHHNHTNDPYFADPWDKRRQPAEDIL